jgi:hypothetical protein
VWQVFINVSELYSYKDSLFIVAIQGTKQIRTFNHYSKTPKYGREWGQYKEVKKVRKGDENCAEKPKQLPNFFAIESKVRSVFFTDATILFDNFTHI